jgi:hypothetical protein
VDRYADRAIRFGAAVALLLTSQWLLLPADVGLAQTTAELKPLGRDETREVDRYQVILRAGATLWDIASARLPLTGLDQGEAQAYEMALQSFQRAFPGRQPSTIRPDEDFTLEVPANTFVAEETAREANSVVYRSFQGDHLTYYPRHPSLLYRLVRKDSPGKAEVSLTGQASSAVDLAREIYQVDAPDFLQVRMVRAAQNERTTRIVVDLNRKFLDDFRNYRERAITVVSAERGLKIFAFAPDDRDNPFLQVEDAIGDENDPGAFPRDFRVAFYRDGTVRKYLVTESGDALTQLNRPDNASWQKLVPGVKEWERGVVELLPAFTPAINETGSLIPGRLLVLSFAPRLAEPGGAAGARSAASPDGAGLTCMGIPLAIFAGLGFVALVRPRGAQC